MRTIITFAFIVAFLVKSEASELFIRLNTTGEYSVTVYDQMHQNRNNIYKYYGLPNGINSILVVNKYTNLVLYNGTISIMPNERIVAEINSYGQLSIIQKFQIQEINWYTTFVGNGPYVGNPYPNNPYPNSPYPNNPYPNNPYPNNPYPGNYVDNATFNLFITSLRRESFDSNKLKMAKNYATSSSLSAAQIAAISKEFDFDNNRLSFAKHAYTNCYDKNNYFLLKDTFEFTSNYNSLLDYIDKN